MEGLRNDPITHPFQIRKVCYSDSLFGGIANRFPSISMSFHLRIVVILTANVAKPYDFVISCSFHCTTCRRDCTIFGLTNILKDENLC